METALKDMRFAFEPSKQYLEKYLGKITAVDCLEGFAGLPDASIDMILTSPPYDNLRNYDGQFSWSADIWEKALRQAFRVLKSGCVMVWVTGDATIKGSETGNSFRQALYAQSIGFLIHDTMIYRKQTPIPQFKSHRYTSEFEYMFVFAKGAPARGELIKVPSKCAGRVDRNFRGQVRANGEYAGKPVKVVKGEKIAGNVWTYSQNNGIDRKLPHKAQFPEKLALDHIISWSNENDIVLDPFAGSGTTAKMCALSKRRFIGFEISPRYAEMANERVKRALEERP